MAELNKGIGIKWGVAGITFAAGIVSTNDGQHVQSLNLNLTSDSQEVRNNIGEVVGKVYYNGRKELSISVIPSALTATNTKLKAKQSLYAHMLPPGTTVQLADPSDDEPDNPIDKTFAGNFNVVSSRMGLTNTGIAVVDLELETFVDNDVTAAVG